MIILMKNNNKCPKCESDNIVVIKNDGHLDATFGNNIQTKSTILTGVVYVNRYIYHNCGYSEEWIDQNDIKTILKSKKIIKK